MKKKIAILLAAVMTATMVPVTAFADSSNSVNKVVTVKDGDYNDEVYLRIQPAGEVEMRDTITLTIENGEFDEDDIADNGGMEAYQYGAQNPKMEAEADQKELQDQYDGDLYEYLIGEYEANNNGSLALDRNAYSNTLETMMKTAGNVELPYKLKRNSKRELEVELYGIPDAIAGEKFADVNKPFYKIPLPFTADGSGNVTVAVDNNGTSIRGGVTYTIANSASSTGDTVTTVDDIKVGSDDIELGVITIKETVQGTFKPGKKVTLKLNSGFEFSASKSNVKITAGINADFTTVSGIDIDEGTIEFTMPNIDSENSRNEYESKKAAAIKIDGLWVTPEDDDNYGEIKVTVSGTSAGITKETIVVAERGDYGFTMKAIEDPTTIYAGRKGYETFGSLSYSDIEDLDYDDDQRYSSYISYDASKEYDSDDYLSATVEFAEITADSWNQNRKLKFTVPDEVKIYDFEIDEEEDCSKLSEAASITNDGHTLEIDLNKGGDVDPDEASKFELQLTLSVDANYEGDIALSVEGAGMSSGDVEDIVIAKAVKPVTLQTETTKTNMGYQKIDTADIILTEAQEGMLVKNGTVTIALDSIYGEEELGFADEDMDYEIEGDLKITKFKVNKGAITFDVDSASTDASKITIKNVKIGTTRSIPYGSYGLKVSGSAIINNYSEQAVDEGCEATTTSDGTVKAELGLGYFDDNEAIKFPNYIDVVTETGTLDKVVKVTIGEKTIVVDGQNYDMDVAPYIQTESSSTMVPLRFVMIALGVDSENVGNFDESNKVSFDANTKTATIFYAAGTNMTTIQFTAGSNTMVVNGAAIPMENGVKAEIVDGRMFVPFRAIGTAINVNVGWDADTRTATYNG